MVLQDLDSALFNKIASQPAMLTYFVNLLKSTQTVSSTSLKTIYQEALTRVSNLDYPIETLAKDCESTLNAYYAMSVATAVASDFRSTYRTLPDMIKGTLLDAATGDDKTFLTSLVTGTFVN